MIEDLKIGLNLAKEVVDLAKGLKDLSDKSDDLVIREAAAELRSKTIDLKETVNQMRDKIIELETQLEFKQQLVWNGKSFEYENNGRKSYICNGCESSGKFTHMTEIRNERGYFALSCPACQNKIEIDFGDPPKIIKSSRRGRY